MGLPAVSENNLFCSQGQREGSSYAALTGGTNGKDYQDFSTSIQKIEVLNGAMKSNPVEVGTWRAGYDTKLVPKNDTILRNMSAVTVYTIVTLEVRIVTEHVSGLD